MFVAVTLVVSLFGVAGIVLGAISAHAGLDPQSAFYIETGLRYHIPHCVAVFVGLVAVTAWKDNCRAQGRMLAAVVFWLLGITGFSGGLYLQAFTAMDAGYVVPAGGFCFMFGWLIAGWSLLGVWKHVRQTPCTDR